jgi:O-antigen/teichoic acid export membrane protein
MAGTAHLMSNIKKNFASSSLWFFIGQGTSNLASFVIFAVLARILGPADFGLVAFAGLFIDLSRSVALAGLPTALIREKEWDDETASTAFWGNMGFSLVLAIVVGGVIGGVASFLMRKSYGADLQWVILSLSACLVLDALRATHEAKLQREFKFKNLAKQTAYSTIGAGAVGVALAFAGWGVWALVVNRIVNSAIQSFLVFRATPWRPKMMFNRHRFMELFRFGMHLGASAVFGQINRRVPELIAGFLISPIAVGYYRVASRMVNMVTDLTIAPMQRTAVAGFSRLSSPESLVLAYRRVTKVVAMVAFPAFFGMAVVASDLVVLLFGKKWEQSGFIMSMLALVGGAASMSYFVQPLLAVAGKANLASMRSFLTLIVNIAVCLVTAPFGAAALALGFSVRAYVGVIPTLTLLKSAVGLPTMTVLRDIFPSFFSATLMVVVVFLLRHFLLLDQPSFVRVAVLVPIGALIYVASIVGIFRDFSREIWVDVAPLLDPVLGRFKKA